MPTDGRLFPIIVFSAWTITAKLDLLERVLITTYQGNVARQKTVLIVEGQALMRQTLRDFLLGTFPDCLIVEAADGAGAREGCRTHRPDLVLMDASLPDVNGMELTSTLKSLYPDLKVILLLSNSGEVYAKHALAAGAYACIHKDDLLENLIPTVADAIGTA